MNVECLTGGAFLNALSDDAGASAIFEGGMVAYSNQVKNKILSFSQETIDQYGVVSP